MKKLIWFVLFSLMILPACGSQKAEVTSTSVQGTTATVQMPTLTPSFTPTPHFTSTSTITYTPRPTYSPRPTYTPLPTDPEDILPTLPQQTVDAISTMARIAELNPEVDPDEVCEPYYYCEAGLSPNGEWSYFPDFSNGPGLRLIKVDGTKKWAIWLVDILPGSDKGWDARVLVVHWSKDGQYVYVDPTIMADGGCHFTSVDALIRVELATGVVKDVGINGSLAFSPNDENIVYAPWHWRSGIWLRNFRLGVETSFTLEKEYECVGAFVWSPDSKKIIFVAVENAYVEADTEYALYLIGRDKNNLTTLIRGEGSFFYPVEWNEPGKVILGKDGEFGRWELDLVTNKIIPLP